MFEIAYRLPSPKTADDETVPIGVDHIDVVRIGLVQSDFGRVALKKWASWIEAWKKYFNYSDLRFVKKIT